MRGGNFTTPGGSLANHIAKWDGSSWTALGSGLNRYVGALTVSGSDLYAGGSFTTAGGKVSAAGGPGRAETVKSRRQVEAAIERVRARARKAQSSH